MVEVNIGSSATQLRRTMKNDLPKALGVGLVGAFAGIYVAEQAVLSALPMLGYDPAATDSTSRIVRALTEVGIGAALFWAAGTMGGIAGIGALAAGFGALAAGGMTLEPLVLGEETSEAAMPFAAHDTEEYVGPTSTSASPA